MSKYAVMPLEDYKNACDMIRNQATEHNFGKIKSGELADRILNVYEDGEKYGYEQAELKYENDFSDGYAEGRNSAWNALQGYGSDHVSYEYAFHRMHSNDFYPVHDIKLVAMGINDSSGMGTFRQFNVDGSVDFDLSARCEECGISIIISGVKSLQYFMHSINAKRIPTIDLSGVTNTYMTFYYSKIQIMDKLIFNEDAVLNANTFAYCNKLRTISEIEGIIASDANFLHSPLDVETMNRIFAHLKDYSGTTGTYTITLKADRETMLTDEEKEVAINKGWTLVWN